MKDILLFLLCIILGFLLSGTWFGLLFLYTRLSHKLNIKWLLQLNSVFASIIPIIIIAKVMGLYPIQMEGLKIISVYLVAILTIILTSVIVSVKKQAIYKRGWELLIYGLDGAFMEIPQRLMMHSFVYGVLGLLGVLNLELYTVLATALIWCMGIGMQGIITGKHFDMDMFIDFIASFVFSLGIGYVYQRTGLILISMAAHFLERILSSYMRFHKEIQHG